MKKLLLLSLLFFTIVVNAQCYESLKFGGSHTLGLKSDSTLWGWGRGGGGILATGNATEPNALQITSISNVSKYYPGVLNTFIIKNDGTLWGVGSNNLGSLGVNSTNQSFLSFQQITTTNNWLKVSPSTYFTLALKTDGTLWAWGQDTNNQTGNPPATDSQISPIQIGSATDWIDIAAGSSSSAFALKTDGTLWGWGSNAGYLLVTDSGVISLSTPTQINTVNTWVKMSVAGGYILAQKSDGTLWAWGGGAGRGVGENLVDGIIPNQVSSGIWKDFSAAGSTSLGIKIDGTLWAWGYNSLGKLGDGTTLDRHTPVQIGTDTNWDTVNAGKDYTSMATKTDGSVWYWIRNYYGEFGNGLDYETTLYSSPQLSPNICVNSLSSPSFESKEKVNLYPNPVQNQLFIDSTEAQSYQIYSILGVKIREGTLSVGSSIDCSNLTGGVYLLYLTNDFGKSSTVKFVKQ